MSDYSDSEEMEEFDEYDSCSDDDDVDLDIESVDLTKLDIEYFEYKCLKKEEVKKLLHETSENLRSHLDITSSLAILLLQSHGWNVQQAITNYRKNSDNLLIGGENIPTAVIDTHAERPDEETCLICIALLPKDNFIGLACAHLFCKNCWTSYIEIRVNEGDTSIICMERGCEVLASEDFVLKYLSQHCLKLKYHNYIFQNSVRTHPELKCCPGPDCEVIVHSNHLKPRRSVCCDCKTTFCFKCGMDYHAPTDCQTYKKWLSVSELEGASESYKYVNTKDCPNCQYPIEKDGGCNHIHCCKCKFHFCWQCLGDWKNHLGNVYQCANFNENAKIAEERDQKRKDLLRLRHIYERWDNHSKSLEFEKQACEKLDTRIEQKTLLGCGSWINWQYLYPATKVLTKCRNTLKYTYPKVYYMEAGPERDLYQFQQSRLEVEIENLSWKIEQADFKDKAAIQHQVDVCLQCRTIVLKQFFED